MPEFTQLQIRISPLLHEALRVQAFDDRRSISATARLALEAAFMPQPKAARIARPKPVKRARKAAKP